MCAAAVSHHEPQAGAVTGSLTRGGTDGGAAAEHRGQMTAPRESRFDGAPVGNVTATFGFCSDFSRPTNPSSALPVLGLAPRKTQAAEYILRSWVDTLRKPPEARRRKHAGALRCEMNSQSSLHKSLSPSRRIKTPTADS